MCCVGKWATTKCCCRLTSNPPKKSIDWTNLSIKEKWIYLKMSRRAGVGDNDTDRMISPDIESGKMKTNTIYELMKLRELQSFVTKIYWLVILCFFAVGVIMALVLSDGTFSDVFMAENLLSSVGISMYILLVALMVMCNNHNEMRVVLLLTVLFFTGCLSGFMLALHLLDVSIILKSAKNN